MRDTLQRCIELSQVLQVVYDGRTFIWEPYILFESQAGNILAHGYKRSGEYKKKPPPCWANLNVDLIQDFNVVGNFFAPMEGFKCQSKQFYKVLFAWRSDPEK